MTTAGALDIVPDVMHSALTQRLTFPEAAVAAAPGQCPLRVPHVSCVSQSPCRGPGTTQVVEVEGNADTAHVTLLDVVMTHDTGTLITL